MIERVAIQCIIYKKWRGGRGVMDTVAKDCFLHYAGTNELTLLTHTPNANSRNMRGAAAV